MIESSHTDKLDIISSVFLLTLHVLLNFTNFVAMTTGSIWQNFR